jgi:aminopeptidase N
VSGHRATRPQPSGITQGPEDFLHAWRGEFTSSLADAKGATRLITAEPSPVDRDLERGVSEGLARSRASRLTNVRYDLSLSVPFDRGAIAARESIAFLLRDESVALAIDFAPNRAGTLRHVQVGGKPVAMRHVNEHIVIPAYALRAGENVVQFDFDLGDAPLNRSDDFLYTIFVPARAREAFPCFDQPDLRARWTLAIEVPDGWEVVANGAEISRTSHQGRTRFSFAETAPLPTYLFALAAGKLSIEHEVRGPRSFRMFHRETDAGRVARNRSALIDLHAAAIDWLEQYTGIPYPFGKFDMLLIPAFQFGGMEHPGAIFFNADKVLLDESATQSQQLARASLVAHETAHLWFGDLVTMEWFGDVWMKEVLASLMADKIVEPQFPGMNHELRFLLEHYPPAYEVDRTGGANAIRQPLGNLTEAGSLYGPVIYHKAPIVMRQLEMRLGPDRFQAAVREYLRLHSYGHASWPDLMRIFAAVGRDDVAAWSRAWVERAGRPTIEAELTAKNGSIERLGLKSRATAVGSASWPQALKVALVYVDSVRLLPVQFDGDALEVPAARGFRAPAAVLPNGEGIGYGDFHLDQRSLSWLLEELPQVVDPLTRGAAWVTILDAMLEAEVRPVSVIDLALHALSHETEELNVQYVLGCLVHTYWRFLSAQRRRELAPHVERVLSERLRNSSTATLKAAYFGAFRDTALTQPAVAWLTAVWQDDEHVHGLSLAESDYVALAEELTVRGGPDAETVLTRQIERIKNPDRQAALRFIAPALSAEAAVRDAFFASLKDASNRVREHWVLEGVRYLHHPVRADRAVDYIRPSLDLLSEIHRTGDIFFPKRWMDATLCGHQSPAAAKIVRAFLDSLPSAYPDRLRRIVLAAADPLFRASGIVEQSG